jgi:hypothetical protein
MFAQKFGVFSVVLITREEPNRLGKPKTRQHRFQDGWRDDIETEDSRVRKTTLLQKMNENHRWPKIWPAKFIKAHGRQTTGPTATTTTVNYLDWLEHETHRGCLDEERMVSEPGQCVLFSGKGKNDK